MELDSTMSKFKRRHFISAAMGLGATLSCPGLQRFARAAESEMVSLEKFSRVSHALGTKVAISILHSRRQDATKALDAAFAAIEQVESQLSIYRADSQLSELNRVGVLAKPHPDLLAVLRCALDTSRTSEGGFDITVQPLWELFESAQRRGQLPTTSEIAEAKRCVDWRRVVVNSDEVRLLGRGTKITLNGIAQGYAADRALSALRDHGVQHALIDTGELAALGSKSNDVSWQAGIQHPRHPDAFIAVAELKNRCLSTSGDYATSFDSARRSHHIFNPLTGISPDELASVSVAAPTAMQADAWSTASFVLGSERAAVQLKAMPGHDALFVLKDGRVRATPGFPLVDEGGAS